MQGPEVTNTTSLVFCGHLAQPMSRAGQNHLMILSKPIHYVS